MKKKLPLILLVVVFQATVFYGQTINVPNRKKALLMKMTATWCTPCGDYHAITEHIYNQHGDSILFINAHVATSDVGDLQSGDFHNAINGGGGIPAYNVDGFRDVNWPPVEQVMVDSARKFLKRQVVANVAFSFQITGSQLSVQTNTKFFTAVSDASEYYVNVFVVENHISTQQHTAAGYVAMIQDRVSRGPMMSGNAGMWGQKIATGNITSGAAYSASFTSTLNTAWVKNNIQLVAVIWKKLNGVYTVLSAEDVPVSSIGIYEETVQQEDVAVYPNPANEQLNIQLKGTGTYVLYNALGEEVQGNSFSNENDKVISFSTAGFSPGVYFIKIIREGKPSVKKIIIEKATN